MTIFDYQVKDIKGNMVDMKDYEGKVLLIVNTATGCGFTPQYEGLQDLYDKYKEKGFVILDFPCNQFGHQAPGTEAEIGAFCKFSYGVTFPMFSKIDVNGVNEEPLFRFLKLQQNGNGFLGDKIKWNFTKFLVDKKGNVVKRFAPTTVAGKIDACVAKLL